MIPARGWLVIAVWLMFGLICWISGPAKAAESPSKPIGVYDCRDIRAAVALFSSVEAAVKAARAAGASDRQIEDAKRCLPYFTSSGLSFSRIISRRSLARGGGTLCFPFA